MPRMRGIRRLFRFPASEARVSRDVLEEITFHLEARTQQLMAQGLDPAAARAAARAACQLVERSSSGSHLWRPLTAAFPALFPPRDRDARAGHWRERRGVRRVEVGAARSAAVRRRRSARARVRAMARWCDVARTDERRDGCRSRLASALLRGV